MKMTQANFGDIFKKLRLGAVAPFLFTIATVERMGVNEKFETLGAVFRAGSCILLRPSSHSHHCGVTACRSMVCVTFPAEVIMIEWIKDIVAGILFFIAMGMIIVLMALVFPDPTLWK